MSDQGNASGVERGEDEPQLPDWYDDEVEAVLDVFRATGEPDDPSWRSLARDCVGAVWAVGRQRRRAAEVTR